MAVDLVLSKDKNTEKVKEKLGFSQIYVASYESSSDTDCLILKYSQNIKKEIVKARNKFDLIIVEGTEDIKQNRIILESKPDVLLTPYSKGRKDFMKERNSGLDHILSRIAFNNEVSIGINFNELLNSSRKYRELYIGRISQNIKLCRKYKVKILLFTLGSTLFDLRSFNDLRAFLEVIGMTPLESKNALVYLEKKLNKNKLKRSKDYITQGISVIK